jgi:excinuclease ABC subunit B
MRAAIGEAERRREIQLAYNAEHGIVPRSTERALDRSLAVAEEEIAAEAGLDLSEIGPANVRQHVANLRAAMLAAAEALEFERAARLRDELTAVQKLELRYR